MLIKLIILMEVFASKNLSKNETNESTLSFKYALNICREEIYIYQFADGTCYSIRYSKEVPRGGRLKQFLVYSENCHERCLFVFLFVFRHLVTRRRQAANPFPRMLVCYLVTPLILLYYSSDVPWQRLHLLLNRAATLAVMYHRP